MLSLEGIIKKSGKLPDKLSAVSKSHGPLRWPKHVKQKVQGLQSNNKGVGRGEKKQEDKLRHDTRCCDSCLAKSADWLGKRGKSAVRAAVA